jgi:hypothetical protein
MEKVFESTTCPRIKKPNAAALCPVRDTIPSGPRSHPKSNRAPAIPFHVALLAQLKPDLFVTFDKDQPVLAARRFPDRPDSLKVVRIFCYCGAPTPLHFLHHFP